MSDNIIRNLISSRVMGLNADGSVWVSGGLDSDGHSVWKKGERYATHDSEMAKDVRRIAEAMAVKPDNREAEVARFLVDAASFLDLTKGTNFPDEFVRDMAKCLRRGRDLVEKVTGV